MTTVLLAIFLVIVLIILSFLLIPFQLSLWFSKKEKSLKGDLRISWLGLAFFKRKIPFPRESREVKKEKKEDEKKQEWGLERIKNILSLLWESWPYMERILVSILGSIKIQEITMDFQLGLESPADTAIITGYIWAFTESTRYLFPIPLDISVQPDFENKILDGFLNLKLTIRLYGVTKEVIRAITKKPVRSLISELRG
ncbi:DUF2953 domain-containing protein [Methanobacterium sp. CWC-01]|uniref:DUF2953 domain-containing protein n=1 Tax=Methanobacterium aridiramus TaxID=2584467 RepID=UPI0025788BF2|nr:DUF2953 domain-containing protein [Methanobacterium sp. CWC-01]